MERFSSLTGARALRIAAIALMIVAAPRLVVAQTPAPADPLKFSSNSPVIVGWLIQADKAKDFEEFWPALRALIAKSDNAELKAVGETLTKIYRVDQPNFDTAGKPSVQFLMQLDSPSTTHTYNPRDIIYTYLGAGVDGSKLTRAEADPIYAKLTSGYLGINLLWKLVKVN